MSLCLLFNTSAFAQYGHPGVTVDPTPLVQAKRPRKPALQLAANRPAPPRRPANSPRQTTPEEVAVNRPTPDPKTSVKLPDSKPASRIDPTQRIETPTLTTAQPTEAPLSPLDALIARAEEAEDANDLKKAAELYRQALAIKADSVDARWGLADALYAQHDYDLAIKEYETAIADAEKSNQTEAGLYNNYANALFRTNTVEGRERSVTYYRKAIEKDSTYADAFAGLSNALRVQKKFVEARQSADRAVQLAPDSSLAHSVLGRVLADQKDFSNAIAEANKAISLSKRDAFAWVNLGAIHYLQNNLMEALKAYLTARSLEPDWALPHNNVGNTYLAMGRPQQAAENFLEAIKRESNSATLYNNLAGAYGTLGRFGDAIPQYQKAAELDPRNAYPLVSIGAIHADQRRYPEAADAFQKAIAREPNNPAYHQALGDVYRLMGKKKEAEAAYKRVKELGGIPMKKDKK